MSVYTRVNPEQLEQFLKRYPLGGARKLVPIAAGITNTNYRFDTSTGSYVLTLYEHHGDDELDYMLRLQQHLAGKAVKCAAPVCDRRGEFYSTLNQRPAAIIEFLPGAVQSRPDAGHCRLIGAELARFHLAGLDFEMQRTNPRGVDWLLAASDMLGAEFDDGDTRLIDATLQTSSDIDTADLPRGAIHADLFHDNALFSGETLAGILDFDYACSDSLVLDLAILMNDWCIDEAGSLEAHKIDAVLNAYQQLRPLQRSEIEALPAMLSFSALRFWMSRLYDKVFPLAGELTFIKDPRHFRSLLENRHAAADRLMALFLPHYMG